MPPQKKPPPKTQHKKMNPKLNIGLASDHAGFGDHINFNGRIATAVKDLAGMDGFNVAHNDFRLLVDERITCC